MARMLGRYRRGPVRSCRTMEHLCGKCSDGDETRHRKRQEARKVEAEVASEMAERIFTAREAWELGRALREGKPVTFRPRYFPPGDSAAG